MKEYYTNALLKLNDNDSLEALEKQFKIKMKLIF